MLTTLRNIFDSEIARLARRALGVVGWLVVALGGAVLLIPGLLGYERTVITGNSMQPAFDRGAVVLSERIPVAELAVGDIITYQPPADTGVTQLVTHRITEIDEQPDGTRLFTTAGDANASPDPWTFTLDAEEQAVVRHHVPLLGFALLALADPQLRMLIIGVPAGLIALRALADLVGALRRPQPEGSSASEAPA